MRQIGPPRAEAFKPREHLVGVKIQCEHCVARYEITTDDLTEHPRKIFVSRVRPDSVKLATDEVFKIKTICPNCGCGIRATSSREELKSKKKAGAFLSRQIGDMHRISRGEV